MRHHAKQERITASSNWLTGGGEIGKLIRTMDRAATPLGPI